MRNKQRGNTKNVKENPKVFWKYVQGKTRTKSRIPELLDRESGAIACSGKEKAEVLARQFSGVFAREPEGEAPRGIREVRPVCEYDMTDEKIRKVLQIIKRNKSPGPDELHPRLHKEVMEEMAESLKTFFRNHLTLEGCLLT